MADRDNGAVERILQLAAYLADRRECTLDQAISDIPGYRDTSGVDEQKHWEAARKKFNRDRKDLEAQFGIVVEAEMGSSGYRLRPGWFAGDERRALLAAVSLVRVDGLGESPQLDSLGRSFAGGEQRVVLLVHEHLVALRDAIAARRRVAFRYHERDRTVDPWAVGVWRRYWYLAGVDHAHGEMRRFRLDRIQNAGTDGAPSVRVLDEPFELPADVDVHELFELDPNAWGHDPVVTARVEVDADHRHRIRYEFDGCRTVEESDAGTIVEIDVRDRQSFVDRILAFGTHAVVRGPDELVVQVRAHLEALVEAP